MRVGGFKRVAVLAVSCIASFTFSNCQNKDVDVKGDLAMKAEQDINFAGVRFTVEKGMVNLSGECPTDKARGEVETKINSIYGVKEVRNSITIAPVVIGTDAELKKSVDSVLKKYAGVQAIVRDSIVTLEGQIKNSEVGKLTTAISTLKPKRLQRNLSVKQNG